MQIRSAKQTQPSYKAGYAKSASESAYPELWDGLVGAWVPEFGIKGSRLKDLAGYKDDANSSTPIATVTTERGFAFNPSDNNAVSTGGSDLRLGKDITIAYWVNVKTAASTYWFGKPTFTGWAAQMSASAEVFFYLGSGNANIYKSGGALPLNEWSFMVLTKRGGEDFAKYHLNAKPVTVTEVGISAAPNFDFGNTSDLHIGSRSTGSPVDADMQSFLLFNRVLADAEIQQLYDDSLAPFRQRRSIPFGITAAPSFNNWYARPGRTNRIVGSGVHV